MRSKCVKRPPGRRLNAEQQAGSRSEYETRTYRAPALPLTTRLPARGSIRHFSADRLLAQAAAHCKIFTARETIRPSVTNETSDWIPITIFARGDSGIVSVGLNAVAFVSDTYR